MCRETASDSKIEGITLSSPDPKYTQCLRCKAWKRARLPRSLREDRHAMIGKCFRYPPAYGTEYGASYPITTSRDGCFDGIRKY